MSKARTQKRASSRAHETCAHCGKRLNGSKGLKMHLEQAHAAPDLKAVKA